MKGRFDPLLDHAEGAERVLVVRVGAMGDVLHALPAVAVLRAERPELPIDWVVDPRWASLLVNAEGVGPVVSRVHLAETKLWSRRPFSGETRRSVLALRRALRAGCYPCVVDLQGTLRSAVIGSFAGAEIFAGFSDPREAAAGWFYRQQLHRRGRHVVAQGCALLSEAVGIALKPTPVVPFPFDPEAEGWASERLPASMAGTAVLLAPSAGWGAKQWPAARFGELARQLAAKGHPVLVNAVREDEEIAQSVVQASGNAARVVSCHVAGLVALTRRVALVIGNDSGPVHLAAALGTPVAALYGPTDPQRNGPWGAGVIEVLRHPASVTSYKHTATPDPGLLRMEVETVFAAAMRLLSTPRAPRPEAH